MNSGLTTKNVHSLVADNTNLYAGTFWGTFKTTDFGSSWKYINGNSNSSSYTDQAIVINGNKIIIGTLENGPYLTVDNGNSWNYANNGMSNINIHSMANKGDTVFAGTNGGVYFSSNFGGQWRKVSSDFTNDTVTAIAIDGNIIYAGTNGGGIMKSIDNGVNWATANNGLKGLQVSCIKIFNNKLFAGTYDKGIYTSDDKGASWNVLNDGLSDLAVTSISINNEFMFAGTTESNYWHGGLFYVRTSEVMSTDVKDAPEASKFDIFPNPASNNLQIISSETYENASVKIINELGTVMFSKSAFSISTNGTISLNVKDFTDGVYFCLINAGGEIKSVKFMVIK